MQSGVTQKLQNKLYDNQRKLVGQLGGLTYLVTGSPQMSLKTQIHTLVKLHNITHYKPEGLTANNLNNKYQIGKQEATYFLKNSKTSVNVNFKMITVGAFFPLRRRDHYIFKGQIQPQTDLECQDTGLACISINSIKSDPWENFDGVKYYR